MENRKFEEVKGKIVIRLANYGKVKGRLGCYPHLRFLDTVVLFTHFNDMNLYVETEDITCDEFEKWGISEEKLLMYAQFNTIRLLPPKIMCFSVDERGEIRITETVEYKKNTPQMYIVTNKSDTYGAAVMMYENVISKIANNCNADLYILPSSVHEVIVVPKLKGMIYEELKQMVRNMNRTEFVGEDILSEEVYIYDRKIDRILY